MRRCCKSRKIYDLDQIFTTRMKHPWGLGQGCFIRKYHDFVKSMSDKFRKVGKRKITLKHPFTNFR